MLKSVHLENFKAQKKADLNLGDFTVLTGYNAAGKTTVLQALVFIKQSLSRKEITYNDYLLKLGDFRELVHRHDVSQSIKIAADFEIDEFEVAYEVEIAGSGTAEHFLVNGECAWKWDSRNPMAMEPAGRLFLVQASMGYGGGEYVANDQADAASTRKLQKQVAD